MKKNNTGYTESIDYTYSYFKEWTPSILKLACIQRGIEPPIVKNACELGFGQGVTLNLLSSATDVNWYGTDFNKSQANYANEVAQKNNNAKIYNMSFEEFNKVKVLPKFDLIVLHGVFSWISKSNQQVIIDFINKQLNKDGLLYISYNSRPGTDAFKPTQYIINQLKKALPASFDTQQKQLEAVVQWMDKFHKTNPAYLDVFTSIKARMDQFKGADIKYLIHEYFNDDWHSFFFSQIAQKLVPCRLKYLGQSRYCDDILGLHYTKEQLEFLKNTPVSLQEDIKDTMTNTQFRRDLWLNNPKKITQKTKENFIKEQKVILSIPAEEIKLEIKSKKTSAPLYKEFYQPVIDLLADYHPRTIENIKKELNFSNEQIIEIITILNSKGSLSLVMDDESIKHAIAKCYNYNNMILEESIQNLKQLASPMTGEALLVKEDFLLLFTKAHIDGIKTQKAQIRFTVEYYLKNKRAIRTDNGIAQSSQELTKVFVPRIKRFHKVWLPFLKAHKVGMNKI